MRKLTAIILSLAAALSLTACGGQGGNSENNNVNYGDFGSVKNDGGKSSIGNEAGSGGTSEAGIDENNTDSASTDEPTRSTDDFTFGGQTYFNCTYLASEKYRPNVLILYNDSQTSLIYYGEIVLGRAEGDGYAMRKINDFQNCFYSGYFIEGQLDGEDCYMELRPIEDGIELSPIYMSGNFKNGMLYRGSAYYEALQMYEYGIFADGLKLIDGSCYVYNSDGSLDIDNCYSVSNGTKESLYSTNTALTSEEIRSSTKDHFGHAEQFELLEENLGAR